VPLRKTSISSRSGPSQKPTIIPPSSRTTVPAIGYTTIVRANEEVENRETLRMTPTSKLRRL
jgi:hypothetical protein